MTHKHLYIIIYMILQHTCVYIYKDLGVRYYTLRKEYNLYIQL